MLDWFKEVGQELGGIDTAAAKKEREEKQKQERDKKYIFSRKTKIVIAILGVLYLLVGGVTIYTLRKTDNILFITKYILQCILDLVILFALIFGKKKGEIVALICMFIFVVSLFLSIVLI